MARVIYFICCLKKIERSQQNISMNSRIIVRIPIELHNRRAIAAALETKHGTDYLFIGRTLQSTITKNSCGLEVGDRDCQLTKAFKLRPDKISATTLQQLDRHQRVIYLTSTDTGYDACCQMAQYTQIMLDIGGIAIEVETAGLVHDKAKWQANYNSNDVFEIYSLFVNLIEGDNYHSCGMHNFGKADVAISLTEDVNLAIYVMNVFNYYRLTESPILQDGHTFKPDIESPTYRLKWLEDLEYEFDSLMHNSYGRWYLSRV